ncbi:hypothetical protein MKL32_10065 [Acinetobacter sp. AOR34_HL]|uniref:virulence factor TspB C-terminal domain-related protein n=1 Tax=Acinetobacter sp. AOR34_HL TaxID=2919384 RepID=UPI0022EA21D2|nr:virulence factor TspB C-terminal domain-related protein [Acinetobacter sp. AOR34_HL]MDA3501921.1 hypothetical protein [Acinetobacter sp. AOR34_HL]
MVHRFNLFVLSILLVVSQVMMMNQVLAAGLGGWTITSQIAQGSSLALEATKNILINGSNVIQNSSAKIKPTVGAVSKVLSRGAAGYALSVAVEQLLGSVEWVLDPANNQIKYWETDTTLPPNTCSNYYLLNYESENLTTSQVISKIKSSIEYRTPSAFAKNYNGIISISCTATTVTIVVDTSWCQSNCGPAPVYTYGGTPGSQTYTATIVGNVEKDEPKTLPLTTVAAQVISNADSHADQEKKVGAQAATTQAAQDMLANDVATQSDVENQLNANARTQTSEEAAAEATPKDPTAPQSGTDIKITFPVFCSWAPSVCVAAQTVISFPQTLTNWWNTGKTKAETWAQSISEAWTATKEWMNEEETPEQITQVEIDQTVPVVPNNQYFNWGAYCPFTPGSQTISLEDTNAPIDYDLTSWCDMATDIRPFVLAAGALMSFLIASGIIMGRDD